MSKIRCRQPSKSFINRRQFITQTTAAATGLIVFPTICPSSALGRNGHTAPSERITLALIGNGKQGRSHLWRFRDEYPTQILAVCDVDRLKMQLGVDQSNEAYEKKYGMTGYATVQGYQDFRLLLQRTDIDGVIIASPDHWHAILAIQAMKSGKDVYCEKPLANCIAESRAIVNAAKQYDSIFQTGSMQRSDKDFRRACELVRNGYIGELKQVQVCAGSPAEFCGLPPMPPPDYLDWDLWLGPAPARPYHSALSPHVSNNVYPDSRKYWDFGGGSLTDLGAHMFDIAQWALDMDHSGPVEIAPPNGKHYEHLTYRYANGLTMTEQSISQGFGVLFLGTEGRIEVNRQGLFCVPTSLETLRFKPRDLRLYHSNDHSMNWLNCIRSRRQPICPAETGHRSATVCHLGNIAYRLHRPLTWDPATEQFQNDPQANRLLANPMRSPWTL